MATKLKAGGSGLDAIRLDDLLHYWQPLFVANPDSGKRAVYVSRLMSLAIEGFDKAESRAVLDSLCDLVEAEQNVYEHVWRVGDLIMWNNLSCVHARTDWPKNEHRLLRRCTIQGERLNCGGDAAHPASAGGSPSAGAS